MINDGSSILNIQTTQQYGITQILYTHIFEIRCVSLAVNFILIILSILAMNFIDYVNELNFWLKVKLLLILATSFATIIVIT